MTDVLGGIVLMLMAISLILCIALGVQNLFERARKHRRSAWYQIDTVRNQRLDYRDFKSHFEQSDVPSILRRQAE